MVRAMTSAQRGAGASGTGSGAWSWSGAGRIGSEGAIVRFRGFGRADAAADLVRGGGLFLSVRGRAALLFAGRELDGCLLDARGFAAVPVPFVARRAGDAFADAALRRGAGVGFAALDVPVRLREVLTGFSTGCAGLLAAFVDARTVFRPGDRSLRGAPLPSWVLGGLLGERTTALTRASSGGAGGEAARGSSRARGDAWSQRPTCLTSWLMATATVVASALRTRQCLARRLRIVRGDIPERPAISPMTRAAECRPDDTRVAALPLALLQPTRTSRPAWRT